MKRTWLLPWILPVVLAAESGGELRFSLRAEPKTLDPLLVADEPSETVRYLTAGVLLRIHRVTQEIEPELAVSWNIAAGGKVITFDLRPDVRFSDGALFSSDDVVYTMRALVDPALRSPAGDAFRFDAGSATAEALGPRRVQITLPVPLAGILRLFDQIPILSARSLDRRKAVLGPFMLAEHKPGAYLLLSRNPQYWKRDASGRRLPYLDAVRLEIQQNRDIEMLRFRQGRVHLIQNLDPELFDRLAAAAPAAARNVGPSLESEQMWFNQAPQSPVPEYRKAWFRSQTFRRAVSEAIQRQDLCRVVYRGYAVPAFGPVSPANRFWIARDLTPHAYDPDAALRRLAGQGFELRGARLHDRAGHPVEFSLITNAGNKARERMAAMIQQDLARLGIRLNIVTLDFPSLIERITRTFDYEACLLGLVNVDLDPNGQMNVWLSSGSHHQWNPGQKIPETPWEKEIDRLMRAQAATIDPAKRKTHFDQVQRIVWEQAPFVYLVTKNSLSAVSPELRNVTPAPLWPSIFWNVERLSF